jgi:hypothetical protein
MWEPSADDDVDDLINMEAELMGEQGYDEIDYMDLEREPSITPAAITTTTPKTPPGN